MEPIQNQNPMSDPYRQKPRRSNKQIAVIFIAVGVAALVLLGGLMLLLFKTVFSQIKKSESYQVAYDYLLASEAFQVLGRDAEDVEMISYSSNRTLMEKNEHERTRCRVTFSVDGTRFTVICHENADGDWYVCKECTELS